MTATLIIPLAKVDAQAYGSRWHVLCLGFRPSHIRFHTFYTRLCTTMYCNAMRRQGALVFCWQA
jgi:hypothetical protein